MMRSIVCALFTILGIATVHRDSALAQYGPPSSTSTVQIESEPLRKQTLSETVTAYGTVATSDAAIDDVSFLHGGRISKLFVQTGDQVHAGQPLIELATDPSATQSYEKAVAALDFAKRDLARTRVLLQEHLATNAQLAAAQKAVDDAATTVATEQKLGNDQLQQTATAPVDAFVVKILIGPGDRVQPNASLIKLARTDVKARVIVGLESGDARRVRSGMRARVKAILDDPPPIDGEVVAVGGSLNPTTKLIETSILLDKAVGVLADGTSVVATINLSTHLGWVVPRESVLHDDKGDYLFQVHSGIARRVGVEIGIKTDKLTEVRGELDPALRVVTRGNYELRDGAAIRETPTPAATSK
jgi:membrane fusion protein, multidrug efflux system